MKDRTNLLEADVAYRPCALYAKPENCDVFPHCAGPQGCAAKRMTPAIDESPDWNPGNFHRLRMEKTS